MPSASTKEKGPAPVELAATGDTSFQASVKIIENKIRNLEKRKMKLDTYQKDLADGKELTSDQLTAVGKYSEVIQNLEFSKELFGQVTKSFNDLNKKMKRQQKKEKEERIVADQERVRLLLQLQYILDYFSQPRVQKDHLNGTGGATKLSVEEVNALEEFRKSVQLKDSLEASFEVRLKNSGDRWLKMLDNDKAEVEGCSKTYKEVKDLLVSLASCEYFSKGVVEVKEEELPKEVIVEKRIEVVEQPKSIPPVVLPSVKSVGPSAQTVHQFKFMQDMSLVQPPHSDPAILAVSSYPPNMNKNLIIGQSVSMVTLTGSADPKACPLHGNPPQPNRPLGTIQPAVSMPQGPPKATQNRTMTTVPAPIGSGSSNFVRDGHVVSHISPPVVKEEDNKIEEWNHIAPKSQKAHNGDNDHDDGNHGHKPRQNRNRNPKVLTIHSNGLQSYRTRGRTYGSSYYSLTGQQQRQQQQARPSSPPKQQNGQHQGIILPPPMVQREKNNFQDEFRGGHRGGGQVFTQNRGGYGGGGQAVGSNRGGPFPRESFDRGSDKNYYEHQGANGRGGSGGRGSRRPIRNFQPTAQPANQY